MGPRILHYSISVAGRSVPFNDVICHLRKNMRKLAHVQTSIYFLDSPATYADYSARHLE
jgi:hypothetical protein